MEHEGLGKTICTGCKREIPALERAYRDADGNEPLCLDCMAETILETLAALGLLEKKSGT